METFSIIAESSAINNNDNGDGKRRAEWLNVISGSAKFQPGKLELREFKTGMEKKRRISFMSEPIDGYKLDSGQFPTTILPYLNSIGNRRRNRNTLPSILA